MLTIMKTNFVKTSKLLGLNGLVLASVLTLTSCSETPEKPTQPKDKDRTSISKAQPLQESDKSLTLQDYQRLRREAVADSNWVGYIHYSNIIWHRSDESKQLQIEEQVWNIMRSLSQAERDKIGMADEADTQAWSALFSAFNQPGGITQIDLLNLQQFDREAIFNRNLLPQLLAEQPETQSVKQIAVMLPMQGKYKVVSSSIRNGIMKAFFASEQTVQISFYDSSNLEELESIYTQAKQDGADRIIGPLRKEAVQLLASFHDKSMLVLNRYEGANIPQFSFKSSNPSEQMRSRFEAMGFERIGILTNDKSKNIAKAQLLKGLWEQNPFNHAEISIYPNEKPRLRDSLGKLIRESASKERYKNVRWSVGEKLEFFPRTRQDLDAIVIFDNTHRLSVFRPQFDFFGLDTPLYSDSGISPKDFQNQQNNKDLKQVEFLSYPAVLAPNDLINKFEAFGWDSFLVTTHFDQIEKGACLSSAKTGVLSMDDNQINQTQVWLTYQRDGSLEEAPQIVVVEPSEETLQQPEQTPTVPLIAPNGMVNPNHGKPI